MLENAIDENIHSFYSNFLFQKQNQLEICNSTNFDLTFKFQFVTTIQKGFQEFNVQIILHKI